MRVNACLLLALCISSALVGICSGEAWFEGYDPQGHQEITLMNMEHKLPIVVPYTALPICNLILSEMEPQIINLNIIVSTWALGRQNGNFETWLSIDDQEPEKLVGIFKVQPSAAGNIYERQYNVSLSSLGDGAHFIKIRVAGEYANSAAGNYDCEGNVSFIIDTTPPKVSILSLEKETYSAANIPLNFTTNERTPQYTYSLDGQENVTINANTTLTGLSEGVHNVTVYATDEAGNIGASETIYFRIDFFPTTLVIASIVTVAVIGIVLLVYFKKRKH